MIEDKTLQLNPLFVIFYAIKSDRFDGQILLFQIKVFYSELCHRQAQRLRFGVQLKLINIDIALHTVVSRFGLQRVRVGVCAPFGSIPRLARTPPNTMSFQLECTSGAA